MLAVTGFSAVDVYDCAVTVSSIDAGSKTWYSLMRRDSKDAVCGRLKLAFAWDVTARSLMSLMLKALEHVLQQRREILCMLDPVSPITALTWSSPGSSAASTATMQVLHNHASCALHSLAFAVEHGSVRLMYSSFIVIPWVLACLSSYSFLLARLGMVLAACLEGNAFHCQMRIVTCPDCCRLRPWGMKGWLPRSWQSTPGRSIAQACASPS